MTGDEFVDQGCSDEEYVGRTSVNLVSNTAYAIENTTISGNTATTSDFKNDTFVQALGNNSQASSDQGGIKNLALGGNTIYGWNSIGGGVSGTTLTGNTFTGPSGVYVYRYTPEALEGAEGSKQQPRNTGVVISENTFKNSKRILYIRGDGINQSSDLKVINNTIAEGSGTITNLGDVSPIAENNISVVAPAKATPDTTVTADTPAPTTDEDGKPYEPVLPANDTVLKAASPAVDEPENALIPSDDSESSFSINLGEDWAFQWVLPTFYSEPTTAEWALADANGVVTFSALTAPAGEHTLALFTADSGLVFHSAVTVPDYAAIADTTDTGSTDAGATTETTGLSAETGGSIVNQTSVLTTLALLLLAALAGIGAWTARRHS